ncbi:MAG: hypothetical protein OXC91_15215, partial [Rhodobacteraceae bacterium]|nr:hypothetical protein [Paracoccaceae bacterium]
MLLISVLKRQDSIHFLMENQISGRDFFPGPTHENPGVHDCGMSGFPDNESCEMSANQHRVRKFSLIFQNGMRMSQKTEVPAARIHTAG